MKTIYGAPATGVPISEEEAARIRSGEPYSDEMMTEELLRLTDIERALRGEMLDIDYDYHAFRGEANIFSERSAVHVLRHLRYDRHALHSHEFFEIACQIGGEGRLQFAGDAVRLLPGSICFIAPGVEHRLIADADDAILLKVIMRRSDFDALYRRILISDTLLTNFLQTALYSEGAGWLMFDAAGDAEVRGTLLRLRYHEVRAAMTDDVMKEALVMQLFCYLTDHCLEGATAAFVSGMTGQILGCIREHFRTITLGELAERFHFTPGYISRLVKRAAGMPFGELINSLKISESKLMLAETKLPVQEIYLRCGFGCKEYFCKTFRRMTGMTPTEYRRSSKSGGA